ncbi:putative iron-regulated membrane protein [Rhizomicrobium palustre]|uniref:Putative iron-regulated membrane protein n=1 Tax=Rhizomicrobium palustre TaxID=189966 RepID=A0A846N497_9PROT|nr:PepSY-associated TM helix domain-containing protein [Rhizomicrobium palustre]NIK89917.1 putative iron-regulated membrane protein [Rhizomicrobium palustre]
MSNWPKIPAGTVRSVLAGHSSLGIAFAALIYLVCFSGTLAVLVYEWQRWETPQGPVVTETSPQAIAAAAHYTLSHSNTPDRIVIFPPQPDQPRLKTNAHSPHAEEDFLFDATGRFTGEAQSEFSEFLVHLHTSLHLPQTIGLVVVGLTGVALLSLLLSGLIAHPRIFRDAFYLRFGGARRLQEADLHNRIGVWALPFHLTVSITGALLGLSTLILAVLALAVFKGDLGKANALIRPPLPKADARPAPLPDLEGMLKSLPAPVRFVMLIRPGTQGQSAMVEMKSSGTLARGKQYLFDGNGKLLQKPRNQEPLGKTIIASLGPLHFGWFGGGVIKIAYVVLGALLTFLTSTGITIWLARKRDKGRPAPRFERFWTGFVWSQPLAFAGTGLASLAALPLLPVWIALTGASCLSSALWRAETLANILRRTSALLLAALALGHIALWRASFADPMTWVMDGLLLALAIVMGVKR